MTPLEKVAYDIGAKGSEPTENERLAFESWMRGHCWAVIGEWDGKQYKHAHESTGFVHGGAMETRRLWAAWRDRGAVARVLAEQAQAVEPVTAEKEIQHINTKNCHWVAKSEFVSQSYKETGRTRYFSTNQPAPPPAGEVPAGIKELLSAKPITGPCGQCKSSADPCYCGNVNTGERAELVELPVAFGEIQYQRPSGQWGRIEGYTRNQMREAVAAAVAVAKAEAKHAQQVAVPPGYVLVPIEPTRDMLRASEIAWSEAITRCQNCNLHCYRAMLAAAQGAKP